MVETGGRERYAKAREIFVTADAGGSNGYRSRIWKRELQRFADKHGIAVRVSHVPPGTSKWHEVEHRLFSFISMNWRGRPLRSYETMVSLISNTTNRGGLVVRARLDRRRYATGKKISKKDHGAFPLSCTVDGLRSDVTAHALLALPDGRAADYRAQRTARNSSTASKGSARTQASSAWAPSRRYVSPSSR